MTLYLLTVYIHILATAFWVGYILFWTILIGPLAGKGKGPELVTILGLIKRTSWPPVLVPAPYRLQLPGLGWTALLLLLGSGGCLLYFRGITWQSVMAGEVFRSAFGWLLLGKGVLVIGLIICQALIAFRPGPHTMYLGMSITLVVVGLSAWLVH